MVIGIDASRAQLSNRSGTENYSYNLIRALAAIDSENRYLLYLRDRPLYPLVTQPNFVTKLLRAPYLWTQARLAFECWVNPPEVLFVPAHTLPLLRPGNLKSVVTIHDLGEEYLPGYHQFPQKYYLSFASRYAAKNATRLIAVSHATKRDLIERYQVQSEKIDVVYEGIDTEFFKPGSEEEVNSVRAKYGLSKNYIFFLGTIQPRKNLQRLISAFARNVRSGAAADFELVIAGGRGWLDKGIYSAPTKEAVANQVKFIGRVPDEDLPALYTGATFFAYPSLFEGFGLPVLEAFGCSTPVLTSKTTSLPEVAGEAAFLVNPDSVEDIEVGIRQLLDSDSLRKKLIKAGSDQVKKFSWEKTAEQTLAVLLKTT